MKLDGNGRESQRRRKNRTRRRGERRVVAEKSTGWEIDADFGRTKGQERAKGGLSAGGSRLPAMADGDFAEANRRRSNRSGAGRYPSRASGGAERAWNRRRGRSAEQPGATAHSRRWISDGRPPHLPDTRRDSRLNIFPQILPRILPHTLPLWGPG